MLEYKSVTDKPHKTRVENCKGVLKEPLSNYGKWAYWRGKSDTSGWYSSP